MPPRGRAAEPGLPATWDQVLAWRLDRQQLTEPAPAVPPRGADGLVPLGPGGRRSRGCCCPAGARCSSRWPPAASSKAAEAEAQRWADYADAPLDLSWPTA